MPPVTVVAAVKQPLATTRCLAWVIHSEARGEPLKGARAVLDAVYARMKKRKKGACAVIAEPYQFSGYRKGSFSRVTDDMIDRYFEAERLKPVVKGCEYFHANYVQPLWAETLTPCKVVGNHKFFKEKIK